MSQTRRKSKRLSELGNLRFLDFKILKLQKFPPHIHTKNELCQIPKLTRGKTPPYDGSQLCFIPRSPWGRARDLDETPQGLPILSDSILLVHVHGLGGFRSTQDYWHNF